MGAAIALRDDYENSGLRRLARATTDAGQSRRCLALAEIYDGGTRSDVARMSGVGLQVNRYWVLRFNAAGPDRLMDRKALGFAKISAGPGHHSLNALIIEDSIKTSPPPRWRRSEPRSRPIPR